MKTAFILFFILMLLSTMKANAQQTIPSLTAKEFQVVSTTKSSHPCPSMTDAQMLAIASPQNGDCVHNTTLQGWLVYNSNVPGWETVGGGGLSAWETGTDYEIGDVVTESNKVYIALTNHTSGTFATDLANNDWVLLGATVDLSTDATGVLPLLNGGTEKALTANDGGIVYSDADSLEVLAPGTSGQILQTNGAAAPSFVNKSISGKAQNSTSVTVEEIQVPNNQLTEVDTNKYLNETGNSDILTNGSFEHSSYLTGWTSAGTGTNSEETSVVIDGKKSLKIVTSSQTVNLSQSSTNYQAQFADGVQCLASVRVKTDLALSVCSIQAGTVSTTNCVTTSTDSKWNLYKVPFVCGGTSNGISIVGASGTGTTYIDDAFVGAVDLTQNVDQSRIAGESYFAGTTSCSWSRTSTTIGAFTTSAACPGPTIVRSTMGQWQTTDSDLPRQTINNLPPGTYKATFTFETLGGAGGISTAVAINDGTTTCNAVTAQGDADNTGNVVVSCTFEYTTSGNRSFEIYAASSSSTLTIPNSRTAPSQGTKFILEYFGSGQVYSSENATSTIRLDTSNGYGGTATKIPRFSNIRDNKGSDITYTDSATNGSSFTINTPGEYTVSFSASFSGTTLGTMGISKNSTQLTTDIQSITVSDKLALNASDTSDRPVNASWTGSLNQGDVIRPHTQGGTFSPTNNALFTITKVKSNTIVGSFKNVVTTPDVSLPLLYSAKVSSAGVISDELGDFVNGNCSGTSPYTCTWNSGRFSQVSCGCTVTGTTATSCRAEGVTTSSGLFRPVTGAPATASDSFVIFCHGSK